MRYFECSRCKKEFKSNKFDKNRIPKYCSRKCSNRRILTPEYRKKLSIVKIGKPTGRRGIPIWKDRLHPNILNKTFVLVLVRDRKPDYLFLKEYGKALIK